VFFHSLFRARLIIFETHQDHCREGKRSGA